MTRKTWIIFGVVVLALIGGLIYLSSKDNIDVGNISNSVLKGSGGAASVTIKPNKDNGNIGDHVFGNKNAKVVVIEYGDFQCPGCGSAYSILKSTSEKYKDQTAFIFRNYPLVTIHPNALASATAAEAAGLMGKYWEMHNILYENQDSWSSLSAESRTDVFVSYAKQIGLNENEFRKKLSDPAIAKKISYDRELGKKVGISGTPAIYVDGQETNQQVKDGKLTTVYNKDLGYVWASQTDFEKLIILPALKTHGIEVKK